MNVTENDTELTEVERDAVATTVIEVGSIGQQAVGSHDDYAAEADDPEDELLIAPEYFDAGYVGSGEFEPDEDADVEGVEDAEILIQETAPEPVAAAVVTDEQAEGRAAARRARAATAEVEALLAASEAAETTAETESIGPRAAARRARQAEAEAAAMAQRVKPDTRRHGVLGMAMVLVLAYQMAPQAVPGGQVGVNVFLGACAMTLWAMRGTGRGLITRGGRRKAECEGSSESARNETVLVGLGLALLIFAAFAPDPTNLGDRVSPLAFLSGLLLVAGVTAEPPGKAARALTTAPLRYLGSLSFALLGTLAFVFVAVPAVTGWDLNAATRTVASLAALGAAALIMRQIERSNAAQIQRARHRNGYAMGLAVLAAVALGATAPGHLSDRQNAEDFVAAVEAVELPASADPVAGLPFADRCWAIPPGYAQATCTFGNDDAEVSVALTGDQSAGSWLPALQGLALAKGWRVTTYLAADCMPGTDADAACAQWSKRVSKAVQAGDYDLVVVAGDTDEAGGAFGESLRRDGLTVIGMPDLLSPTK